jgi:TonB-dependent siderophore receptor
LFRRKSLTTSSSVYGTTRLSLGEPLKLILGGRLSWLETKNYLSTGTSSIRKENRVFTPYAGLIYDLNERWSLYASYTDIFRAQNSLYKVSGDPLKPVIGANFEAGIKGEFYGGRLNTSFALFRIIEENRSQPDPDNPAPCAGSPNRSACYIEEGRVRGQGFEIELGGEIRPGWQIITGYTYVKTEYLRDRSATGAPSANEERAFRSTTPEHLLKLWTTYRLPGRWQSMSVGGGVNAQSGIHVRDGDVRFGQGGYAIWNARAAYLLGEHWELAFNINNLFDKHYYQRLGSVNYGNIYGEPRNWMLTLRGAF